MNEIFIIDYFYLIICAFISIYQAFNINFEKAEINKCIKWNFLNKNGLVLAIMYFVMFMWFFSSKKLKSDDVSIDFINNSGNIFIFTLIISYFLFNYENRPSIWCLSSAILAPLFLLYIKFIYNKNMLTNIKLLFIHIEKCMGTSFRFMLFNYLKNFYKKDEIYFPELLDNTNLTTYENYTYINNLPNDFKVLLCHYSYNTFLSNDINDRFIITCVREPYDRIISHYYFFSYETYQKKLHELHELDIIELLSYYGNLITLRLIDSIKFNDLNIDLIKKKINNINCIIVMENINEEIKYLNDILNKKFNTTIELQFDKKNNNRENYKDNINLDIICLNKYEKYFINDIIIYNYILSLDVNERFKL